MTKNKQLIYVLSLFVILLAISALIGNGNLRTFSYSALLILTTLCIASRLSFVGYIVAVTVSLCVGLEFGYKIYFHERINSAVLKSFMDTNIDEAVSMSLDVSPIFIYAVITASLIVFLFHKISGVVKWKSIIILILCSLIFSMYLIGKKIINDHRFLPNVLSYPESFGDYYYKKSNLIFGGLSILYTSHLTKNKYNKNIIKSINENINKNENGQSVVVFVLGESSMPGRYSLYGYPKETTPNLSRLISDDTSCIFDNVHSVAPITRDSNAITLSFHTPEDEAPMFKEKSVIDLAKDNNYISYWISSQSLSGLHDTKYGYLVNESDVIEFTNWNDDKLPIRLKSILDGAERTSDQKLFITLHMAGSHRPYKDKFDSVDKLALPDADDYDLSIRKTDRILGDIIKELELSGLEFTLFFVSDHGEVINKGHGLMYGGIDQYLIPYVIKSSVKKPQICEFVQKLRNENGYINGLSNKFVLLNLLGYTIDDNYIQSEVSNDRVLHSDGKTYSWPNLPEK